ncbi:MAG: hypothetical protein HUU46_05620 [Candidatus Hydrogenedentes bacterium]|nr:hypothetical protein [Candidatus Hydrogenedentota bacterium]
MEEGSNNLAVEELLQRVDYVMYVRSRIRQDIIEKLENDYVIAAEDDPMLAVAQMLRQWKRGEIQAGTKKFEELKSAALGLCGLKIRASE